MLHFFVIIAFMKKAAALVVFWMITNVTLGQITADSTNFSNLGLFLGASHISLVDQTFSPITYRGSSLLIGLQYSHRRTNSKQSVLVSANQPTLNPSLTPAVRNTLNLMNVQLNCHYQRLISSAQWRAYLGGGLHNFFSFRTFNIERNQEIGYDLFSSLNLAASIDRRFSSGHTLEFSSTYGLLAYVTGRMRVPKDWPPEVAQALLQDVESLPLGAILKSGDLLTINRFVEFTFQTDYRLPLSEKITLGLSYWFRYYQYPKYLGKVTYGESQFLTGLFYTF